jgi:hypothetical protein
MATKAAAMKATSAASKSKAKAAPKRAAPMKRLVPKEQQPVQKKRKAAKINYGSVNDWSEKVTIRKCRLMCLFLL